MMGIKTKIEVAIGRWVKLLLASPAAGGRDWSQPADQTPIQRPMPTAQSRPLHLVAVGDILLAGAVQARLEQYGYDYPFRHVAAMMPRHDLLVGNLEGPITDHDQPISRNKDCLFRMDVKVASALRKLGFDLLNLANNHSLDYGLTGLRDTQRALEAVGIGYFGAGPELNAAIKGKIVEVAGLRIGLLGFMQRYSAYVHDYPYYATAQKPGVPIANKHLICKAIKGMRGQVDTLIVSFHWGRNYSDVCPAQVHWGRLAVDLGADLVIGHNPHNLQGIEIYRQVPILYALGNFTFGTIGEFDRLLPNHLWHHGWIAEVRIEAGRVTGLQLIPIATNNRVVDFQPRAAEPSILPDLLALLNAKHRAPLYIDGDRLLWGSLPGLSTGRRRDLQHPTEMVLK